MNPFRPIVSKAELTRWPIVVLRYLRRPAVGWLVKAVLLGWVLCYLWQSLETQLSTLAALQARWQAGLTPLAWGLVVIVAGLLPVNWGLEALKWQGLARKMEQVSFGKAFVGVLTGLALGLATPNRLGEYAGRIGQMHGRHRLRTIGAVWLGRFVQLYVTLLAGSLALLFYAGSRLPGSFFLALGGLLLLGNGALAGVLLARRPLLAIGLRQRRLRPIRPYVTILRRYSDRDLSVLLGLATLRYGVFSLQFGVLLYLFGVRLPVGEVLSGIALVFLSKSLFPSLTFLADLGVREAAAVFFFGNFGAQAPPVVAASLVLWLLNLLLPALLGAFFILQLRLSSETSASFQE